MLIGNLSGANRFCSLRFILGCSGSFWVVTFRFGVLRFILGCYVSFCDVRVSFRRKDALAGIEAASVPESSMKLLPPTLGDPKPLFPKWVTCTHK